MYDNKWRGFLQLFQQPVIKFTELLLHFSALAAIIKHIITDWVVPCGIELYDSFEHQGSCCFYFRLSIPKVSSV